MKEKMNQIFKKLPVLISILVLTSVLLGYLIELAVSDILIDAVLSAYFSDLWQPSLFLSAGIYIYSAIAGIILFLLYLVLSGKLVRKVKQTPKPGGGFTLENPRFMTEKERNYYFEPLKYTDLSDTYLDGIPVGAALINKGKATNLQVNLASPAHTLIIGSKGAGVTTTFIDPMMQILSQSSAGSSIIITDPKDELFQTHSKKLHMRGYNVIVMDLRDPNSSGRWNPLESVFDLYWESVEAENGIFKRRDNPLSAGLELFSPAEDYGDVYYEYRGKAYADSIALLKLIKGEKQRICSEVYEDLNDLVGVLFPVDPAKDPVLEKGAQLIIMTVLAAMLEDSEIPELKMTREKFNFSNVRRAINNSDNDYAALRRYLGGYGRQSMTPATSHQALTTDETEFSAYVSVASDKLSLFDDEGICALTSASDINPGIFADKPTVLFMKIPEAKDFRHCLAAAYILQINKALLRKSSSLDGSALPRNVYFILDGFGDMPKIDKLGKTLAAAPNRGIWFSMVIRGYSQLNSIYGTKDAKLIKNSCGIKVFIGSDDIETCKEFSELCGGTPVPAKGASAGAASTSGQAGAPSRTRMKPLIYPSELQSLNSKDNAGNAIIVSSGNHPLKTKFTPVYLVPLYEIGAIDPPAIQSDLLLGEEVSCDLDYRNQTALQAEDASKPG